MSRIKARIVSGAVAVLVMALLTLAAAAAGHAVLP